MVIFEAIWSVVIYLLSHTHVPHEPAKLEPSRESGSGLNPTSGAGHSSLRYGRSSADITTGVSGSTNPSSHSC